MSKDHIPVEQLSLTSPSHFLMRQPNAPETMFSSPSTEGISYEFVDLTVDNHRPDNGAQTITPPYNLSDRQLRHSNQSAGSYRGVPKSYAELITLAIESSPRRRLMLSDIYAWMYKNVPEFVDRRLPPSETSWKNSIRHNLSLHDKFIKEVNPASPKGSFWTMDKMDVTTCDSGFSTSFSSRRGSNSSRRGSGSNLAESIKQFQAIYNQSTEEVLPQVAQKLEQEQTRRCSISSSHKPKSNGGIFRKRSRTSPTSSSGTLFKDTRVLYQKRRRNTMCNDNSPKYEAIQNSVFVRNPPNGGYPVSSCQDVTKVSTLPIFSKLQY